MSLKLNSSGGGSVTLQEPTTASNRTLNLPDNDGTVLSTASTFAGTGPAFSAYQSSTQSISNGVVTKVQLQSEEFDTNNNFDSTTNYRFTPTVAGYYQLNGTVAMTASVSTAVCISFVYKNGAEYKVGSQNHGAGTKAIGSSVNAVVYFNGSTDYAELYAYQDTGSSKNISSGAVQTYFTGAMVRAA